MIAGLRHSLSFRPQIPCGPIPRLRPSNFQFNPTPSGKSHFIYASDRAPKAPFPWAEVNSIGALRRATDRYLAQRDYAHHTMAAETLLFRLFGRHERGHQFELYLYEDDALDLWRGRAPLKNAIASIFRILPQSIRLNGLFTRIKTDRRHYYSMRDRMTFEWALDKIAAGFSVQELKDRKRFFGRLFFVTPNVGHIASEYEAMVYLVKDVNQFWLEPNRRRGEGIDIAEIGCGPGQMGCTAACEIPRARVDLIDINPAAKPEAERHILNYHLADRVHFYVGDLFSPPEIKDKKYDIITASPIPADVDLLKRIIRESRAFLKDDGVFILQFQDANIFDMEPLGGASSFYLPEELDRYCRQTGLFATHGIFKMVRGPSIFLIATPRKDVSLSKLQPEKRPPGYYLEAFTRGEKPLKVHPQRRLAVLMDELCHDLAEIRAVKELLGERFLQPEKAEVLFQRAMEQIRMTSITGRPDYDRLISLHIQFAKILEDHGRDKKHLRLRYLENYDYVFGPVLGFVNHSILMDAVERKIGEVRDLLPTLKTKLVELAKADSPRAEFIEQMLDLEAIPKALECARDWISLTTAFFTMKRNHYGELIVPTHFDNWYIIETALVESFETLDRSQKGLRWVLSHLKD